jgi:HSP20 family molecular chaperone IbpA
MIKQSATVMQKKQTDLGDLFVPSHRIYEHMRVVFDLVSRRAYEMFENRGGVHGNDWEDWYQAEAAFLEPVNSEVSDSGDAFIAVVDIAAYRPQDLRMSADPHCLKICGRAAGEYERAEVSGNAESHPRAFLIFYEFPAAINPAKASAEIRNNVLEVRVPKAIPSPAASN